MRKNTNKSFYHYTTKEFNEAGEIINIKFYMTLYDLQKDFKVSLHTLNYALNKDKYRLRKYKNFEFERVHIPVYKKVANDVFSHNFYYCSSSDEDYQEYNQDHKEIEYIEDLPNGEKNIIYSHN